MRNNVLLPYKILDAADGTGALTSLTTNIQYLDNVGIQVDLTGGTSGGTLAVQVSANHTERNGTGAPFVVVAGTWATIASQVIAAGAPTPTYFELSGLSAPFIRLTWTPTVGSDTITAIIVGKKV
jgi:hypothetical protein